MSELPFPSDAWWEAYVTALRASEVYPEVSAEWEGDVSLVVEAEPDKGLAETVAGWLDLWHGACRADRWALPLEEAEAAAFVIRAPYSRWQEVIRGTLDPVKGMMQGKLKVQGDLPAIIRHVKAANELVRIASDMPTRFV